MAEKRFENQWPSTKDRANEHFLTDLAIMDKVLGHWSSYRHGWGRLLRG